MLPLGLMLHTVQNPTPGIPDALLPQGLSLPRSPAPRGEAQHPVPTKTALHWLR